MWQTGPPVTPSSSSESSRLSSLTPLVLLLLSCVLLLLLLNCMLLGYRVLLLSRKKRKRRRAGSEATLLQSTVSTRHVAGLSEAPSRTVEEGKADHVSIPVPVSSSLTSSKARAASGHICWTTRPDGAARGGSESLKAPSTIRATMSTTNSTTRADLPRMSQLYNRGSLWRIGAPGITHYSDSETDRANTAPPNSPAVNGPLPGSPTSTELMRRSSTMALQNDMIDTAVNCVGAKFEYEYTSIIPPEQSCVVPSANSSTVGPGLDSDFGASAGISLRILSCDSEGFSNAVLSSPLEWDYYDPCYVSQNNVPKHMCHLPTVTTKQYWV